MADDAVTGNWRVTSRVERHDFFNDWLGASEHNELTVNHSPVVARGRDLQWIETPNEHEIAMLIGPQVGFPTQGTSLCKVVIPANHHTGRQRHGEEAIHILEGSGFVVVDGLRYDFHDGTTIHIPYMSEHQLFANSGADVVYVTASAMDLDLYVKLGRLHQLADKGKNEPGFDSLPAQDDQFDTLGRRVALHLEDAPDEQKRRDEARNAGRRAAGNPHRHGAIYILMGGGESPSDERNGFTAVSAAMTKIGRAHV